MAGGQRRVTWERGPQPGTRSRSTCNHPLQQTLPTWRPWAGRYGTPPRRNSMQELGQCHRGHVLPPLSHSWGEAPPDTSEQLCS